MNIKNIVKMLKQYSKVIMALIMIFIVTVGAATLSIKASSTAGSDVQAELKSLLGNAKSYGVFVENAIINNDFESNIAVNNLIVDGTKDIGNTVTAYTNVAGTIYIKNFESGTLQLRAANNIVMGSAYTKSGNDVTFGSGKGVISIARDPKVNLYANANYVNISSALSTVAANFSQFTITTPTFCCIGTILVVVHDCLHHKHNQGLTGCQT